MHTKNLTLTLIGLMVLALACCSGDNAWNNWDGKLENGSTPQIGLNKIYNMPYEKAERDPMEKDYYPYNIFTSYPHDQILGGPNTVMSVEFPRCKKLYLGRFALSGLLGLNSMFTDAEDCCREPIDVTANGTDVTVDLPADSGKAKTRADIPDCGRKDIHLYSVLIVDGNYKNYYTDGDKVREYLYTDKGAMDYIADIITVEKGDKAPWNFNIKENKSLKMRHIVLRFMDHNVDSDYPPFGKVTFESCISFHQLSKGK